MKLYNPKFLRWLQEARDECEEKFPGPENNRVKAWDNARSSETSASRSEHAQAIRALKNEKCCYAHPRQLLAVKFIGNTTVSYLEKRMMAHCQEKGRPMPNFEAPVLEHVGSDSDASLRPTKRARKSAEGREKKKKPNDSIVGPPAVDLDDDSSDPEAANYRKGKGKAKKSNDDAPAKARKKKEYLPRARSGGYAILVALVKAATERGDANGWHSQAELEELAKPHTDTSFTEKKGGGGNQHRDGFYTAWAGMKKLLAEALVIKQGQRPVSYQLTQAGLRIGNACAEQEGEPAFHASIPNCAPRSRASSGEIEDRFDKSDSDDDGSLAAALRKEERARPPGARAPLDQSAAGFRAANGLQARVFTELEPLKRNHTDPGPLQPASFGFVYLTETGARSKSRLLADTYVDPDDYSAVYKIEYRKDQKDMEFAQLQVLQGPNMVMSAPSSFGSGSSQDTQAGWLRSAKAPMEAPGLPLGAGDAKFSAASAAESRANDARNALMGNEQRKEPVDRNALYKQPRPLGPSSSGPSLSSSHVPAIRGDVFRVDSSSDDELTAARPAPPRQPRRPVPGPSREREQPVAGPSRQPFSQEPLAGPWHSMESEPLRNPLQRSSTSAMAFDPLQLSRATASSLTAAAAAPDFAVKDAIIMRPGEFTIELVADFREGKMIKKIGHTLAHDVQTLELGDFIWVAKRKGWNGNPADVLVLDGILERKRLDDLISSIKDKRYEEQKARIKRSGTTRRMYMIQMYEQKKNAGWEQQYWTISSQSQVSDGFTLAQVESEAEAAAHVTRLTRVMTQIHENSTLYGIPDRFVNRASYLALQADLRKKRPTMPFLITFAKFQKINRIQHTVFSTWANMLHSLMGVSPETVCQLVDKWPTPVSFRKAIKNGIAEAEEQPAPTGSRKRKHPGEDWFQSQLGRKRIRGIKGALSRRIWDLFAAEDYNASAGDH